MILKKRIGARSSDPQHPALSILPPSSAAPNPGSVSVRFGPKLGPGMVFGDGMMPDFVGKSFHQKNRGEYDMG